MKVYEVFESIQGEGINVGEPCVFVRMFGCNNHCTWCDSKYAVNGKIFTIMTPEQLLDTINNVASDLTSLIVFTGGEPLLQQDELECVIRTLKKTNFNIHVETNGTIIPNKRIYKMVELFNCSPKLPSSGNLTGIKYDVMKTLAKKAIFKFVVNDENDLLLVKTISEVVKGNYMLMAEGQTRKEQVTNSPKVIQWCIDNGFTFSPRMHILTWDLKRGV